MSDLGHFIHSVVKIVLNEKKIYIQEGKSLPVKGNMLTLSGYLAMSLLLSVRRNVRF